jgi:hypothetical protein
MSKQVAKTSTAISVYLSPKANDILKRYVENSGWGSVSRTVEELILCYDKLYNGFISSLAATNVQQFFSNPQAMALTLLLMIGNFELSNGSSFEQKLKKEVENMQNMQMNAGK